MLDVEFLSSLVSHDIKPYMCLEASSPYKLKNLLQGEYRKVKVEYS